MRIAGNLLSGTPALHDRAQHEALAADAVSLARAIVRTVQETAPAPAQAPALLGAIQAVHEYHEHARRLMARALGLVIAGMLVTAPALAQESLLPTLQTLRAQYPTPMSKAQLGELLTRTAQSTAGWVLLRKMEGNNCPAMGTSVSCDYLVYAPTGQGYDVLVDQEGSATPTWNSGGDVFTPDRYVAVNALPPPQPNPQPQPAPVTEWMDQRFNRLEAQNRDHAASIAVLAKDVVAAREELAGRKQLQEHDERLQAHDERPGFIRRFMGSPWGAAITAAFGTYLTEWYLTRDTGETP
jgi:hypothetical protein